MYFGASPHTASGTHDLQVLEGFGFPQVPNADLYLAPTRRRSHGLKRALPGPSKYVIQLPFELF